MKILVPDDGYPEKYWFYYDHDKSPDYLDFTECKFLSCDTTPLYRLKGKVSLERVREYDYLFSDGPNFISWRLMAEMNRLGLESDVQFVKANVIINDLVYEDYYSINYLKLDRAFDLSKSIYMPLIKSMPDGPKKFSKIVLMDDKPQHKIFRAREGKTHIIVSDSLASELEKFAVKGVHFVSGRENI